MKSIKLISAAALVMTAAPAFAANWIYLSTSKTDAVHYYDADTLQRIKNDVTVWEWVDFSRDQTSEYEGIKARVRYDCRARTFTVLSEKVDYRHGTTSSSQWAPNQQKVRDIVPDSENDSTLAVVCAAATR